MNHKFISCPDCKGHGYINGGDDHSSWSRTCSRCHGTGYAMVPKTRGDRIRDKSDDELAAWIYALLQQGDTGFFCQEKPECKIAIDTEEGIPDSWCLNCMKEWLQQPVPAQMPRRRIFEDKQESGLLED